MDEIKLLKEQEKASSKIRKVMFTCYLAIAAWSILALFIRGDQGFITISLWFLCIISSIVIESKLRKIKNRNTKNESDT